MICPSGDAVSEAKLIDDFALHSSIAGGAHASHANCVSSQTDNAARATSAESKKLKGAELDAAKALVEAHAAVPANMQHAVDCWLKLSPEAKADAYEMHGLGCTGHSANLTTDDSHKHSESTVLPVNMVRDRAARVLQRFFCVKRGKANRLVFKGYTGTIPMFRSGFREGLTPSGMCLLPAGKHLNGGDLPSVTDTLWKVSKLLSSEGEHHAYYLNEHRAFDLFATDKGLSTAQLLSCKGSRQNYSVQQATRVLRNTSAYVQYLHETRIESDVNLLVEGVWEGLRDRFVLGALRARSFVDVAFTSPLIFFTHSELVTLTLSLITNSHTCIIPHLGRLLALCLGASWRELGLGSKKLAASTVSDTKRLPTCNSWPKPSFSNSPNLDLGNI